ncbi:MAG: lamin tail domain-containing protein [Anaerolineae bacterium]
MNAQRSQPIVMAQTPGARVAIDDVRADGPAESVTIVNHGQIDQPLAGWALASLHGMEVFVFPEDTVLTAGHAVRVLSGEGAQVTGRSDLLWTRDSIWSNRSDTVLLFDGLGHEVARRTYPRPTVRQARVPKRKVLLRDRDGYHLVDWDDADPPASQRELGV